MTKPLLASCRTQKIKYSKVRSADDHNRRLIDVKHRDPEGIFTRTFGDEKTLSSKIEEYKSDGYKIRKDGVPAIEIVLSASPEYFRKTGKAGDYNEEKMQAWRSKTEDFLKEKYGKQLTSIDLHLDESTPHIHAMIIPVFEKEKSRRRTNEQIDRGEKSSTYIAKVFDAKSLTSKRCLIDLQDEYASALKPLGIERGVRKSKAKHTTLKAYYGTMEHRVQRFNSKIHKLKKARSQIKSDVDEVLQEKRNLSRLEKSLNERRHLLISDTERAIESEVQKRLPGAVHAAMKDKKKAVELASKHQRKISKHDLDR